jgi:hypothetical protein
MSNFIIARVRRMAAIVAPLLVLAACGSGGGGIFSLADVGSGGTGIGFLTGFGSLIVDGMRRDDSAASYTSEADQASAIAMAPTGAMLGHSVEYSYDGSGKMMSVLVSPELAGTVTAVGPTSVTVFGTTVDINSDATAGPATSLVGYGSLPDIKVGDRIEVHGLLKTDSLGKLHLQATLVVQKPAATGARLTGYVTQYDAAAGTFALGSNLVTVGSATISPAGAVLSNGQLVTVWSNADPLGNAVSANTVRIKWPTVSNRNVAMSGAISSYTGAASFQVRNMIVDASSAVVAPSGVSFANGKYVVVVGSFDVKTNKLTATSVTVITPAAPTTVELHGTVANFVSAASFTVRGVVVDASAAAFIGGTASQLANGVFVEVHGAVANNLVRAATVTVQALSPLQAPAGSVLDVGGVIATYGATTGSYTITLDSGGTMSGTLGSSMFYDNGIAADFVPGQSVHVSGMFNGGLLSTFVVNFCQSTVAPGAGNAHMEGIAYNVNTTSFMLNGVTIQNNGVTFPGGGMMGGHGMMAGLRVSVDVQLSNGQYLATAIRLLNG